MCKALVGLTHGVWTGHSPTQQLLESACKGLWQVVRCGGRACSLSPETQRVSPAKVPSRSLEKPKLPEHPPPFFSLFLPPDSCLLPHLSYCANI